MQVENIFFRGALLTIMLVGLMPRSADAIEIDAVAAHYQDGEFRVTLSVVLNAPLQDVAAVLRDYPRYPELDSRILEATVLSRPEPNVVLLATKLRACSGIFCRTVQRVERVTETPLSLFATVVPAQSDVLVGSTRTLLRVEKGKTRVDYDSTLQPNFWVPWFIGRPLMLRTLREASLQLFERVEKRAQQTSALASAKRSVAP